MNIESDNAFKNIHPTELRTLISPSSAVELKTTSALANYAIERQVEKRALILLNKNTPLECAVCYQKDRWPTEKWPASYIQQAPHSELEEHMFNTRDGGHMVQENILAVYYTADDGDIKCTQTGLNPDIPVFDSLVQHESSALDHAATKADSCADKVFMDSTDNIIQVVRSNKISISNVIGATIRQSSCCMHLRGRQLFNLQHKTSGVGGGSGGDACVGLRDVLHMLPTTQVQTALTLTSPPFGVTDPMCHFICVFSTRSPNYAMRMRNLSCIKMGDGKMAQPAIVSSKPCLPQSMTDQNLPKETDAAARTSTGERRIPLFSFGIAFSLKVACLAERYSRSRDRTSQREGAVGIDWRKKNKRKKEEEPPSPATKRCQILARDTTDHCRRHKESTPNFTTTEEYKIIGEFETVILTGRSISRKRPSQVRWRGKESRRGRTFVVVDTEASLEPPASGCF
uniref:Uncharacterized protein n=1 Tax=Timema tahoe TaxID=61484 RepID=A0A7R9IFR5_9NEOP|nr:unnamed protein product [Timema tahoe]